MSRPSGHGPTYIKDPATGQIVRSVYKCACHGREFETKAIMQMHTRQYKSAITRNFDELVRTGNLGQPAWERLPGETPLQYKRFQSYLQTTDPGTGKRSLERTTRITGTEPRIAVRASSRWHWRVRADLWDRHLETIAMQEYETKKRQSARRQAGVGQKLQELAMAGTRALLANPERVAEMSGNEIAKLADIGTKIERLANSDPTAISEDRGQVKLVWDGPKPKWAPPDPKAVGAGEVPAHTIDGGHTLVEKVGAANE